jgi:hypothetical protein
LPFCVSFTESDQKDTVHCFAGLLREFTREAFSFGILDRQRHNMILTRLRYGSGFRPRSVAGLSVSAQCLPKGINDDLLDTLSGCFGKLPNQALGFRVLNDERHNRNLSSNLRCALF